MNSKSKNICACPDDIKNIKPSFGEREEAKYYPNGYVYRIIGLFDPNGTIPPEAILGAWEVDASGNIIGDFIKNPKYTSKRWITPDSTGLG